MQNSLEKQKKIQAYAQVLLETSRAQGRQAEDLEILKALCSLPEELVALLEVMSQNGDLADLKQVYETCAQADSDKLTATVTSAVALTDEMLQKITAKLEADFGREIYLIDEVDPSIMGGFIIEVAGERRDVSVRTQLEGVRENMTNAIQGGDI